MDAGSTSSEAGGEVKSRGSVWSVWGWGAAIGLVWLILYLIPISNQPLRWATGFCFFLFVVSIHTLTTLTLLFWIARVAGRWGVAAFMIVAILLNRQALAALKSPSHFTAAELRGRYVQCLRQFQGSPYLWGGENWLGIDCSGLVRKGLINALTVEGFRQTDLRLIAKMLSIWYYDTTAQRMAEPDYAFTTPLFQVRSLNEADYSKLLPGDFAVTRSGIHVLAYLGNQEWIEADPVVKRTITLKAPGDNAWLQGPMRIVRWDILAEPQ